MADLEGRLHRHSKAFYQLLSLIPAKHYFSASDSSTQWNKRKQTKEESKRAKKAKLDPDSIMSAADFGRKRQVASGGEDERQEEGEELMTKKQKRQKKKLVQELVAAGGGGGGGGKDMRNKSKPAGEGEQVENSGGEAEEIQLNGFSSSTQLPHSPSPPPPQSNTSSQKLKPTTEVSPEKRLEQKARLEARIQQLRAKRNADSPNGTPARNRNELMAARRREEAQARKERKKEIRLKQKATMEQTKSVVQPDRGKSPEIAQRNPSINPQTNNRDKEKGKVMVKKANSKKSRPGFEGSLKATKKGKKYLL